jgi:uncharacterized membrane protein YcaP (DUF421 family)
MIGQSLADMFQLAIPVLEKIIRPFIIYIFLVIGFRIAGKRELASLNPLDLVVLLTISNTVQNAIIGNDNSVTGGIIGATALLSINYLLLRLGYNHPKLRGVLEGQATTLIDGGELKKDVLHRELIDQHELEIAANKQGFINLNHVEKAVIEPDGAIFFDEKEPTQSEVRFEEIIERLERIEKKLGGV